MLIRNPWVDQGLASGSMGQYKILRDEVTQPGVDMPSCVLMAFPGYAGPVHAGTNDQGVPLVPITPAKRKWKSQGLACSRTQIPLQLAFAITITNIKA